ncbi:MAG: tail tape measure protein [Caudoviricetes sp.]|nr:MAG: tail tape measure protein [Caudoviricetes sp.]
MATETTSLQFRIDSTQVKQASTDLDNMADAGDRAETSQKKLEASTRGVASSATAAIREMSKFEQVLEDGAKTEADLAAQRQRLNNLTKSGMVTTAEAAKYSQQLDKQQQAMAKSAADEAKALERLLKSIDPTRAAMERLDKETQELQQHMQAGRITMDDYQKNMAILGNRKEALSGLSKEMQGLDLSGREAKDSAVALARSLSTGDFTQAASSLSNLATLGDNTAGALARAAAPFVALAAVAATFGVALYQNSSELSTFNKSLAASESFTETTAGALQVMATNIGQATGKFGEARDALNAVVRSGDFTVEQFEKAGLAAVQLGQLTGQSAAEVVRSFQDAEGSASKMAATVGEKYGLITVAQYDYIRELENRGQKEEALNVTLEAISTATKARLDTLKSKLGEIERGWGSVGGAATSAWEKFKGDLAAGFGAASPEEEFETLRKQLEFLQSGVLPRSTANDEERIIKRMTVLQNYLGLQKDLNDEQGRESELLKSTRNLQDQLDAANPDNKRIKAVRDLNNEYKNLFDNLKQGEKAPDILKGVTRGADGSFSGGSYDTLLKKINDDFAKGTKQPGGKAAVGLTNGADDIKRQLQTYQTEIKAANDQLEASFRAGEISTADYYTKRAELIEQDRDTMINALDAQSQALRESLTTTKATGAQKNQIEKLIADNVEASARAQEQAQGKLNVLSTQRAKALKDEQAAIDSYIATLRSQIEAQERAGQRAADAVGKGSRQNRVDSELARVDDSFNQQERALQQQLNEGRISSERYQTQLRELKRAHADMTATILANEDKLRESQGDWTKGAKSALEDYKDSAADIAGQTRDLFSNAFQGAEDALVNFVMTGKANFDDFAKAIIADLARIAVRQSLVQGMTALGFSSGGYTGDGGKYEPAGVVHAGEFVIRKEVTQQPGMKQYLSNLNRRGYADGGYVEPVAKPSGAGMPSGGATQLVLQSHYSIDGGGGSNEQDTQAAAVEAKRIGDQAAYSAIQKELRPGGLIWAKLNNR